MSDENPSSEPEAEVTLKWYKIIFGLKKQFGKKPDMNAIMFLIGMNELGRVKNYSKEEKTDLLHIATCKLLSYEGYYKLESYDKEGWPHYELKITPPYADLLKQELLLKKLIVKYFEEKELIEDI